MNNEIILGCEKQAKAAAVAVEAALGTGRADRTRRGASVVAGTAAGGRGAHPGAREPGAAIAEAGRGNQQPANLAFSNAPVFDLNAVGCYP